MTRTDADAPLDGFLLLDKPPGMTSFQALRPVKRLCRGRKVGHAGTLDPAASGLLLVGVGAGTRLLEHLEGMPKTYDFTARFGLVSDTYDMEGEVRPAGEAESARARGLSAAEVEAALAAFRGPIVQTPPAYSAIKIAGKRACDRVRDGEAVALAPRPVTVHSLELLAFTPAAPGGDPAPGSVPPASGPAASLRLTCSKGTYVRSLVHDLGRALGCGAVTGSIRRLAIGPFRDRDARPPEALTRADLLPPGAAVVHLPAARIGASRLGALFDGRAIAPSDYALEAPGTPPVADPGAQDIRVLGPDGGLLALARIDAAGLLRPRKVLVRP